ncbi:MAG: Gfo/Idh/MocA family protein [Thermoplasmataceae archaeon]
MDFGVIGLGNHSSNRIIPAIRAAGFSIASVYSSDAVKGDEVARANGSEYYSDLERMLSSRVEAVYIGSPNFLHYPQAKLALEAGKHVLLEKQMTLSVQEAADLVSLSRKNGLKLAVGFHMRFHPAVEKIRNTVLSGDIGKPVAAFGMWGGPPSSSHASEKQKWWTEEEKVGGGSIMATGVHVIDSLMYVLGKRPETVSSVKFPRDRVIEKTQQVSLIYPDMIATAVSSRLTPEPDNSLHIFGTEGTAVGRGIFGVTIKGSMERNGKVVDSYSGGSPYEGEIRSFAALVRGEKTNIAVGEDGEAVVRVVNAANESAATGRTVSL